MARERDAPLRQRLLHLCDAIGDRVAVAYPSISYRVTAEHVHSCMGRDHSRVSPSSMLQPAGCCCVVAAQHTHMLHLELAGIPSSAPQDKLARFNGIMHTRANKCNHLVRPALM